MKKITMILICLVSIYTYCFSQTELKPKKKHLSPQFEKLVKYGITNNNQPSFIWNQYGYAAIMHIENNNNGLLIYGEQGGYVGHKKIFDKGTIVAGYKNGVIAESFFIYEDEGSYGIFLYAAPDYRIYLSGETSKISLDGLIDMLIEDQTDLKWIKDEL